MDRIILCILQITTIYNAMLLGWDAHFEVAEKKIILKKKIKDMNELDNNTQKFLDTIMDFHKI